MSEAEIELRYGKLREGFDLQREIEAVIRKKFAPRNSMQLRSKQGLAFNWPYFTAVQGHGAQLAGQFETYEEGDNTRLVIKLTSTGYISETTRGKIRQGLEKVLPAVK